MNTRFWMIITIMVPIIGTAVFAEASEDTVQEENCKRVVEELSVNPDSIDDSCLYKLHCEGLKFTTDDEIETLDNDYMTQLFFRNNPTLSLDDDAYKFGYSAFDPSSAWVIRENQDRRSYPLFSVNFNSCAQITNYVYDTSGKEQDHHSIRHLHSDNGTKDMNLFGEGKYAIVVSMLGHHVSPKIQINEFDILPDEIRCNEGRALIQKHDDSPACIKEKSIPKLVERGWANIGYVAETNGIENNILRYSPVLFKGTGVILEKNEFTTEDFEKIQQRKADLEGLLEDRSISDLLRDDMKNERNMIQYYSQQAFDEGISFELVSVLWEKRMQVREFLSAHDREERFPIACSGGISVGFHAYSLDEKYVGKPTALIISVPEEHFTKPNLQKADDIIREQIGKEIDVVYNKSDCYAIALNGSTG